MPRGSPHRLRPGTSPQALRIPPHGGRPAFRSTAGGGSRSTLAVSGFRLRARLGISAPSPNSGRRGITPPPLGYNAPHLGAGGTSTLLISALPSAPYAALRLPCSVGRRSGSPCDVLPRPDACSWPHSACARDTACVGEFGTGSPDRIPPWRGGGLPGYRAILFARALVVHTPPGVPPPRPPPCGGGAAAFRQSGTLGYQSRDGQISGPQSPGPPARGPTHQPSRYQNSSKGSLPVCRA